jgi:hypothetical protein
MPVMPTSQQIPPGYEQPGPGVPPPPQGLGAAPGGNGNIIRLGGASGQVNPSMPAPQPNMVNPNGQIPPTPTRRIIRPKPINVN